MGIIESIKDKLPQWNFISGETPRYKLQFYHQPKIDAKVMMCDGCIILGIGDSKPVIVKTESNYFVQGSAESLTKWFNEVDSQCRVDCEDCGVCLEYATDNIYNLCSECSRNNASDMDKLFGDLFIRKY